VIVVLPLALAAITATLDPSPQLTGNCNPTRVHFTGHISSDAPVKVTYTWVRMNYPAGRTFAVDFNQPGTAAVSFDILLRKAEKGAVILKVVFPTTVESSKIEYQVKCK
jgi:hypothetical protein